MIKKFLKSIAVLVLTILVFYLLRPTIVERFSIPEEKVSIKFERKICSAFRRLSFTRNDELAAIEFCAQIFENPVIRFYPPNHIYVLSTNYSNVRVLGNNEFVIYNIIYEHNYNPIDYECVVKYKNYSILNSDTICVIRKNGLEDPVSMICDNLDIKEKSYYLLTFYESALGVYLPIEKQTE